tara:strand:- start:42 stop:581 length:540 start_codon:yes stop_codon:yes gene_type:complete
MNKQIILSLGALAAACLVAGPAAARPHDLGPRLPISLEQMQARATTAFESADSNGDGQITVEEFDAAELPRRRPHGPMGKRRLEHGPGEMHDEMFDALDSDGDGYLSREEVSPEHRRDTIKSLMKQRAFSRLDEDDSGTLTQTEFSRRLEWLETLDANEDGEVTRDELRSGMRDRFSAG